MESPDLVSVSIEFDGKPAGLNGPSRRLDRGRPSRPGDGFGEHGQCGGARRLERHRAVDGAARPALRLRNASGDGRLWRHPHHRRTLVGGDKARIVEVQSIAVESDFPDTLLYLRNYDKPGFIGDLGSLCGRRGIVATFHLGRREEGGEAIALSRSTSRSAPM